MLLPGLAAIAVVCGALLHVRAYTKGCAPVLCMLHAAAPGDRWVPVARLASRLPMINSS